MGWTDHETTLSLNQAVTTDAASQDHYDCLALRDMGRSADLVLDVSVSVAADATTGDETYAIEIQVDDNESFSSATTLTSRTIPAAQLTAGSNHAVPIPPSYEKYRYIRAFYNTGGTTPTITLSASIKPSCMFNTGGRNSYAPKGYVV